MTYRASISRRRITFGAAFLVIASTTAVFAAGLLETIDQEVSTIYERSRDAVVKVHAQHQLQIGNLPFSSPQRMGTGFFIDKDGHIKLSDFGLSTGFHKQHESSYYQRLLDSANGVASPTTAAQSARNSVR